jgi:hypothetical protein
MPPTPTVTPSGISFAASRAVMNFAIFPSFFPLVYNNMYFAKT